MEFSLKLEEEAPTAGDDTETRVSPAITQVATQHFHTIILGNHTGNIANASPGSTQMTSVVNKGDLAALGHPLRETGVPDAEVKDLEATIAHEGSTEGVGPKAGAWLGKATRAIATGAWKLASGVGIQVITKLVLSYYCIHT